MSEAMHRNSAVLFGNYRRAFVSRAITGGYVSPVEVFGLDDPEGLHQFDYDVNYKHNPHKTTTLQTFLLFDKIVLLGADPGYDYSNLESTGIVEVTTALDDHALLGSLKWNDAEKAYARFLKPVVLDHLIKKATPKEEKDALKNFGLRPRTFYSDIFDFWMADTCPTSMSASMQKSLEFMEISARIGVTNAKEMWEGVGIRTETALDWTRSIWAYRVTSAIGQLMTLLGESVARHAVLLQNDFPMQKMNSLDYPIVEHEDTLTSYQILRVSFEKLIRKLPALDSIEDVLRLKDKRERDIARLREVVMSVEMALREGRSKAMKTAEREVTMASNELARGNRVTKVSKWTTYLSLPIAFIEMYLGMPPVIGISAGTVGTGATFIGSETTRRNDWLQVVR